MKFIQKSIEINKKNRLPLYIETTYKQIILIEVIMLPG